jgi:hypothetical protein
VKTLRRAIVILFISTGTLAAAPSSKNLPAHCDRQCLIDVMDQYVAALVAHDPSQVPLSPHVEFVENTVPMQPGDGLWKTATAPPTTFKIYVPDPVSEQIGFMCVMQNDTGPIQLALRLKIRHGQIVAAEHLFAGNLRPASLKNLETPRPGLLSTVPPAERVPRAQMLKIALSYYTALVTSSGKAAPFADDCVRHENGAQTTGNPPGPNAVPGHPSPSTLGCAAQLDTGVMSTIKTIEPRRVFIADQETGLVFGLSQFRHPMTGKLPPSPSGAPRKPFDNVAAHIFKVSGGKIHEIEALGHAGMPYNAKTGWENFPDHGR